MVEVCPEEYLIYDVSLLTTPLVDKRAKLCKAGLFGDDHTDCQFCEQNPEGSALVKKDIQGLLNQGSLQISTKRKKDEVAIIVPQFDISEPLKITYQNKESVATPLIICLPGPSLYESDKVVPNRYNAVVLEDGKEVIIEAARSIENIANFSCMTRSGHMFSLAPL